MKDKSTNKNKKKRSPYAKYDKDGNIILDDTAITPEWYEKFFESKHGIDTEAIKYNRKGRIKE